jgi:hypothetical protein
MWQIALRWGSTSLAPTAALVLQQEAKIQGIGACCSTAQYQHSLGQQVHTTMVTRSSAYLFVLLQISA